MQDQIVIRTTAKVLMPFMMVFGLYVIMHGEGGPGGGFILSSSNSIHAAVKPENYMAMLDTLKEYGRYPLNL